MNEITISVRDFSDRMRTLLREAANLAADRKELELQGKASGINVAPIKKWLKVEVQDEEAARPTKINRLIAQTQDQVLYGESLGHDIGIYPDSEKVSVRNNSNEGSRAGGKAGFAVSSAGTESDVDRQPISAHVTAPQHMPDSGEDRVTQPVRTSPQPHSTIAEPSDLPEGDRGRPTDDKESADAEGGSGAETLAIKDRQISASREPIHEASATRAPNSAALSEAEFLGPIPDGFDRRAVQ